MFGINPFELMIILMVGLIVVGPKRLPEIGRTIGRAFSEIRRVQDEIRDTVRFDLEDDDDEGPPSYPSHRDRVPEEPPGPSAVELASAAARDRDGARDASSEEEPADPWSAAADLDSGYDSEVLYEEEDEIDPRGPLPSGPPLSADDLIDFHFLLEDERYIEDFLATQ